METIEEYVKENKNKIEAMSDMLILGVIHILADELDSDNRKELQSKVQELLEKENKKEIGE